MNDPLTHGEFKEWQVDHFIPHCEKEDEHHKKVERLTIGAFGDGNGNAGAFEDVKNLVKMQQRIDAWLDLMKIVWKGLASAVITAAALFALAERMGWLK